MLLLLQAIHPEPWYKHTLENLLEVTVPVVLWLMDNRRRAKNQAKERQDKVQKDIDDKHKENTKRLDAQDRVLADIYSEKKYFPAHGHSEKTGQLKAEGITWPPKH